MDERELRALVERLVAEMNPPSGGTVSAEPRTQPSQGEEVCLPDPTEMDLRTQYRIEHPVNGAEFIRLKKKTPARLGIDRVGTRYPTGVMLRMRADHAAAQDAVFTEVPEDYAESRGYVPVQTRCTDKDQYLTRPDLGRRFDEKNQNIIRQTVGRNPKVVLVVGDGLSSTAIETNAEDCMNAIRQGLEARKIPASPVLFVRYCRVGASDHIGSLTDAELVCMLVGERPGLVTAESMSAYLTYAPHIGVPESQRTVISNIHRGGTPAVEAGAHIAELIETMLKRKASGVELKAKQAVSA